MRGAGDVNNDGVDDLIIGARYADSVGEARTDAGEAYVIFGNSMFDQEVIQPPVTLQVTGPVGLSNDRAPAITWTDSERANSFEITVELIGSGNLIVDTTVTTNSFQLTSDLSLGQYRTSVRANLNDGSQTEWATQTFRISLASTIDDLPANANGNLTPTIQWDEVDGALAYRLLIRNQTRHSLVLDTTVDGTSYTPVNDFQFGQHQIWVQPVGAGDFVGQGRPVKTTTLSRKYCCRICRLSILSRLFHGRIR